MTVIFSQAVTYRHSMLHLGKNIRIPLLFFFFIKSETNIFTLKTNLFLKDELKYCKLLWHIDPAGFFTKRENPNFDVIFLQ